MVASRALRGAAAAMLSLLPLAAAAQGRITGSYTGSYSSGATFQVTFDCTGAPTCNGTYGLTQHDPGCNNNIALTGSITIGGLNLGQPGPIQGQMTETGADYGATRDANGNCALVPGSLRDKVVTYTGTWTGLSGTLSVSASSPGGGTLSASGSFTQATTRVTGSGSKSDSTGFHADFTFSCAGTPTCVGQYTSTERQPMCTNDVVHSDVFTLTGLNLAQPGTISGQFKFTNGNYGYSRNNTTGACAIIPGFFSDKVRVYTGTWSGSTGTITAQETSPTTATFSATTDAPAPTFTVSVVSSIDSSRATVTANIQFRPEDIGRTAKVFVFAIAPSTIVTASASAKSAADRPPGSREPADGPASCVLAQLDANGHLTATSVSGLQAYSSGTLSAQGQAVNVLNNVSTPQVAGATFYVGYGSDANAMYTSGVNQSVVTVPGSTQCPSASSISASYEGLWLKSDEAGWGVNVTHQGTTLFATWFTYDTDGSAMWLVMSNGTQTTPGNFTGTLYRTVGPAFSANPFTSISYPANYATVGTLSFSFTDANNGTMSYTVNGFTQSKTIQRYVYVASPPTCVLGGVLGSSPNYQDLWLRSADGTNEAGWGINIAHQGDILFATWFTYLAGSGSANKGMWIVMSNGNKVSSGVYTGALQTTSGPPFAAQPFNPNAVVRTTVGTGTFTFTDANSGTFSYTVNGVSQSKPIARFIYATPATACQ